MAKKSKAKYSLTKRIVGLTIFLDSLFLVIIVVVGMFAFSVNANQLKNDRVQTETQSIMQSTESILDSLSSDAFVLSQASDVVAYIEYINSGAHPSIDSSDPNYPMYEKVMLLMNNLMSEQGDTSYKRIFLATEENCLGGTDGCLITDQGQVIDSSTGIAISDRKWYDDIQEKPSILSRPYKDALDNENVITYVQRIYDLSDKAIGYIGIEINLGFMNEKISQLVTSQLNNILIISRQGNENNIVYYTDPIYMNYLFHPLEDYQLIDKNNGFEGQGLSKVLSLYEEDEIIKTKVFSENYMITYNEIEDFNWMLVVMVRDTQILSYEVILLIALGIVGLLLILISFILSRSLKKSLQPIHDIIASIEEIKNGNYQVVAVVEENNEIKEIADAINLMSKEIDRQVKLVYDTFAYDQLTGLKNKSVMIKEINNNLLTGDKKTAVCLLQVDNLKEIIIIKGQMMGDSLIKAIASEIKKIIYKDEILLSNGGNELVYIIPDFTNLSEVRKKVDKIIQRFRFPITVNNIKIEIKIFTGIATYPSDDYNLEDLIKKCDVSIYKDKNTEKKQIIFYNDKISQEISYQAQVSEQLAQALDKREIFLKYQPLIDNKSEIYGFEALARWSSPELGNISPDVFIGNAEENYLIIPIGTWILREACKTQVALRKKFDKEFMMSVNVSLIQILQNDYVDIVKQIVKETDINPEYLTLELTESIFIKTTIALDDKIDELHAIGIKFSLDDFGTGYASLTYLRKIAFDNLKIDKSFIDGILGTKKENRIVGTIVSLVHSLDMKVIAEGVEHKNQYEYLRQISADIFQGFLLSKPLDIDGAVEFIDQFYKIAKTKRIDVLASRNE